MTRPIPGDVAWLQREVRLKQEQRDSNFEPIHEPIPAKVVSIGGSIFVPNKPGFIWVYRWGLPEGMVDVLLGTATVVEGDWVYVGHDLGQNNRWRVLKPYDGGMTPNDYEHVGSHTVGIHGGNHEYRTESPAPTDPTRTFQAGIQMLKTTGNGDLTITVQPLVYYQGSIRRQFNGVANYSLAAYVPASGQTRYVLIYLNRISNSLAIALEATVPTGNTPVQPSLPSNAIPSALVQLTNGQTVITTASHVLDARSMLEIGGASAGSLSGPVLGSTDNAIARWDGSGGTTLQNSTAIIDDSGNLDLGGAELRDFAEQALEISPASPYAINWSAASLQQITIAANTTFTYSGLAIGKSITIEIIQGGAGGFTATWPATSWIGNAAPTLSTTAGDVDVITLYVRANGTTVVGAHVGSYTP